MSHTSRNESLNLENSPKRTALAAYVGHDPQPAAQSPVSAESSPQSGLLLPQREDCIILEMDPQFSKFEYTGVHFILSEEDPQAGPCVLIDSYYQDQLFKWEKRTPASFDCYDVLFLTYSIYRDTSSTARKRLASEVARQGWLIVEIWMKNYDDWRSKYSLQKNWKSREWYEELLCLGQQIQVTVGGQSATIVLHRAYCTNDYVIGTKLEGGELIYALWNGQAPVNRIPTEELFMKEG